MKRFVQMFRYDPVKDPTARIRLDYDPKFGNAVLADENTHLEQIDNPDARHVETLASIQFTTPMMRWLATKATALASIMERADAEAQARADELAKETA